MTRFLAALGLLAGLALPAHAAALTPDDQAEIYQLYHSYALALDSHDGAALAATFAPGGSIIAPGRKAETTAALAARIGEGGAKEVPSSQHMVSLVYLKATAAGANGSCYGIDNVSPAQDGQFTGTPEFYSDSLVKTRDGWRFKTRRIYGAGETD